jgi:hypothetical protein
MLLSRISIQLLVTGLLTVAAVSAFQIHTPQVRNFQVQVRRVPTILPRASCRARSSRLFRAATNDDDAVEKKQSGPSTDPLVKETSRTLKRVFFFSWWAQVILTTISTVILLFARSVVGPPVRGMAAPPPFFLSGTGVIVSVASIIWTWGNGARLSRRLVRRPTGKLEAANLLRRAVRVGVSLNLVGLFVNLVAAEQIVGNLAIKVLTSRGLGQSALLSTVEGSLQPLDVSILFVFKLTPVTIDYCIMLSSWVVI